eukprot:Skav227182  [mRNA]  locus=scaffold2048:47659:48174:+ [translate_table: standard]
MALKFLWTFVTLAVAAAETVDPTLEALEADDSCAAGGDCSLELNQLRGMKDINYHDALMEEDEETNVEGGACTNGHDLGIWKKGGKRSFDGSLNHCGRSCAAGFACTKSCMAGKGYSSSCASCMAHLVECGRDKCINQCVSNDKSSACTGCVKHNCRPKMKACSGLNAGGH